MNFTMDASIVVNAVVIVIGVLIKMELRDIRDRIMRLENVFIAQTVKELP